MADKASSKPLPTNPLGASLASPERYSPEILYPIPRAPARAAIGLAEDVEMRGFDHWQAFELSWLSEQGKPEVAVADLFFECSTPAIVESKSLKLYLNSMNHERIASPRALQQRIESDLANACGGSVSVRLYSLGEYRAALSAAGFAAEPLEGGDASEDAETIHLDSYPLSGAIDVLDASLLRCGRLPASETRPRRYVSDLFRSNCPVTNQPDWASIEIRCSGVEIEPSSLLSFLCSFRNHQGYHEECAERIFGALHERCGPESLYVGMNYLRRGGLDINVYRASYALSHDDRHVRGVRQ